MINRRIFRFSLVTLAAIATIGPEAPSARAQAATVAPAPAMAEIVLGRATGAPQDGTEVTYTVFATQPVASKLTGQKIRLEIAERDAHGHSSHSVSISTGKYKTVGQLAGIVNSIFRKFLSGAAPNQDLGKIGDAKFGGELHFVAETPDHLRFDYVPSETSPENAMRFGRADVQAFVGLLGK